MKKTYSFILFILIVCIYCILYHLTSEAEDNIYITVVFDLFTVYFTMFNLVSIKQKASSDKNKLNIKIKLLLLHSTVFTSIKNTLVKHI